MKMHYKIAGYACLVIIPLFFSFLIKDAIIAFLIGAACLVLYWFNVSRYSRILKTFYKDKEIILCAATLFDDGKQYAHQPKNIDKGLVLCGHRHSSIFPQIGGLVKERQELGIYEKEQGFLTNTNRFVGREEAGRIAYQAGQTDVLFYRLHSEDLY